VERFTGYAADARYAGRSAEVTGLWITTENPEAASDSALVARITDCSGYWFVGGVQSRVMQVFRPASGDTPGYGALMRRWRDGAVVAGSSAGAAMMSSRSIGSGAPAAALEFGVTRDANDDGEEDGEGVWVLPGMDFVPWAIVGQHHLARGRWGRLVVAVLEEEDRLGLGIDENTALVYDADGVAEVVGASGVLMFDVTGAVPGELPRTATGIRVEFLGAGDRVDVRTLEVTRRTVGKAAPPPPAAGSATSERPSDGDDVAPPTIDAIAADPFARWALLHLLHAFAAGAVEEVVLDGGARTLTLRRGDGFAGWAGAESGVQGTPAGLSAGPLILDITR
jgi:cyanophycinase